MSMTPGRSMIATPGSSVMASFGDTDDLASTPGSKLFDVRIPYSFSFPLAYMFI